jgi:hypothetical protein
MAPKSVHDVVALNTYPVGMSEYNRDQLEALLMVQRYLEGLPGQQTCCSRKPGRHPG